MTVEPVTVDCAQILRPNVDTIDRLARIGLGARRRGRALRLVNAQPPLVELIRLCGLAERLGVEVERQPEEREQPGRVQEEGQLRDPPV